MWCWPSKGRSRLFAVRKSASAGPGGAGASGLHAAMRRSTLRCCGPSRAYRAELRKTRLSDVIADYQAGADPRALAFGLCLCGAPSAPLGRKPISRQRKDMIMQGTSELHEDRPGTDRRCAEPEEGGGQIGFSTIG